MKRPLCAIVAFGLSAPALGADAYVTNILQHGSYIAVYLSPDPGPLNCQQGSPYLMEVNDLAESKQRFAMLMTALVTGKKVTVWQDGCNSALWGVPRPVIWRLMLSAQ